MDGDARHPLAGITSEGVNDDAAGLTFRERCRYKLTYTTAQGLALVSKQSLCFFTHVVSILVRNSR